MKRRLLRFLPSLFALAALLGAAAPASAQLTRDEAVALVVDQVILPSPNAGSLVAYAPQTLLPAGSVVAPYITQSQPYPGSPRVLSSPTWFVWIDDEAPAKFTHATRFVYVDANHPNPVVGDGIVVDVQGWWPVVNGVQWYSSQQEQQTSPDLVWGTFPVSTPLILRLPSSLEPELPVPFAATAEKKCAIVIAGDDDPGFKKDVDRMAGNLTRNAGVPAGNVQKKVPASKADLEAMIAKANRDGCTKVYLYISAHGAKENVVLNGDWVSSDDLSKLIKKLSASGVCVILDSCYSGSFIDNLKSCPGQSVTVTTSTDGGHTCCMNDNGSYFTDDLSKCWGDSRADGPDAGSDVSQKEAYDWVLKHAPARTTDPKPQHKNATVIIEPIDPIDEEPIDIIDIHSMPLEAPPVNRSPIRRPGASGG